MYLKSDTGEMIRVNNIIIKLSQLVNDIIKDDEDTCVSDIVIPLPYKSSDILNVSRYCDVVRYEIEEDKYAKFMSSLNNDEIFRLCVLSDFLGINCLLDITKNEIVKILGKNPEELTKIFGNILGNNEDTEEFIQAHSWENL